jgi:phosphate transport system substrate-binding protein
MNLWQRLMSVCVLVGVVGLTLAQSMNAEGVIQLPSVDPLDVSGNIIIAGSSTVFPLTERLQERFIEGGFLGDIVMDSIGTGAGFERFCVSGDTDISNASRAIRDAEILACEANGRTPIEFRVGTDALAVVVNNANEFAVDLSLEELALLFSTAETWQDVNPDFPPEPIARFIPGTDSGTFDYFVEAVFDSEEAPILSASNVRLSEDDNLLAEGIEDNPYAVGFFGFAYLAEHLEKVHAINIDGVEPNAQSAEDGTYPLSRPLFIYSDAQIMRDNPQVAAFISFYLTHVNDEILDVGYFPASVETLNAAKDAWWVAQGNDSLLPSPEATESP